MPALGTKLWRIGRDLVMFSCPGCRTTHQVRIPPHKHAWHFNGNGDAPTFKPSIRVDGVQPISDDEYVRLVAGKQIELLALCCHSFVTDGRIRFLPDCTHALAGKTVDLPDFDAPSDD